MKFIKLGFTEFLENHMLSCQWKELGIECMGCGFQRSVIYLLKGEFLSAFVTYPAIYSLLLMVGFMLLHLKFNFDRGHLVLKWMFITNVVIIAVSYIIKFI
jgi:hypothetical protein